MWVGKGSVLFAILVEAAADIQWKRPFGFTGSIVRGFYADYSPPERTILELPKVALSKSQVVI